MGIFKRKPIYHYFFGNENLGGFEVDFYMEENNIKNCYMRIVGKNEQGGIFDIKLNGHSYGYLMESARQGKEDNIHGFCAMLFLIATGIYEDERFGNDVMKAVMKYQKRLFAKAESNAKQVTEAEEMGAQALFDDVIAESTMSKKELKKKRAEDKALMKEIIRENNNG